MFSIYFKNLLYFLNFSTFKFNSYIFMLSSTLAFFFLLFFFRLLSVKHSRILHIFDGIIACLCKESSVLKVSTMRKVYVSTISGEKQRISLVFNKKKMHLLGKIKNCTFKKYQPWEWFTFRKLEANLVGCGINAYFYN